MSNKKFFAVIDTETTWSGKLMSVGIAISDSLSFAPVDLKYYIITPECNEGGMFSSKLMLRNVKLTLKGFRADVTGDIRKVLNCYDIHSVFAYNAKFDINQLRELSDYEWYDIMALAAYKQYNHSLPQDADYCSTGRLKRDYGVEPVLRLLSGNKNYCETHNALCDAADELKIMQLMKQPLSAYCIARIN